MSNRSDFDFDDDDFNFDDDNDNNDFRFDDDDDVDFESGLGDDFGDDDLTFDEEEADSRGPSRTFVIIAAVLILMFVVALVALFLLSGMGRGLTPFEITSTAIAQINETVLAQGLETETQQAFDRMTETQVAADLTATANAPTATPTNTLTPSPTETPPPDLTDAAATAIAEQLLFDLTATALSDEATRQALPGVSPPVTQDTNGLNAVALTATALAQVLLPTTAPDDGQGGGVVATPTREGGFGPIPTALPDTGLFDDLAAGGSGSMGVLLLAIAGLAGVIFGARRLRTVNR